jgi:hypothetical protein
MKQTLEMARENLLYPGVDVGDETIDQLKRFEALVRADEREACLNCYSPDDTATDWADKIKARGRDAT